MTAIFISARSVSLAKPGKIHWIAVSMDEVGVPSLQKDAQVTQDLQITLSGRDLRGGLCLLQTKQDEWTPGQSLTDCLDGTVSAFLQEQAYWGARQGALTHPGLAENAISKGKGRQGPPPVFCSTTLQKTKKGYHEFWMYSLLKKLIQALIFW